MDPKIKDGAMLRKNGAGASVANKELQAKYLTYIAEVAIAKGDWVALNFNIVEPVGGYGGNVILVDTDVLTSQVALGVAIDPAAAGAEVIIQVEGRCDFAKIPAAIGNPGGNPLNAQGLALSAVAAVGTVGLLDMAAAAGTGEGITTAVLIDWGTADAADSIVWLINPLNQ